MLRDKLKNLCACFFVKDKGGVAILTGLLLSALIGFAALAVDVGLWYNQQRQLQWAADAGAIGGGMILNTPQKGSVNSYVSHDVALNGCTGANNCTIVAINNPPTSGPNAGSAQSVEVILSMPAQLYLSGLFLSSPPTINARAVAGHKAATNCLVSLSTSGIGLNVKGGAALNSPQCGVYVNSSSSSAIKVPGNASITTTNVNVVGGVDTSGGGIINGTVATGASPVTDPYSGFTIPSYSGCTQSNYKLTNSSATINPGVYCGGIKLVSSATLTMNPGVYILDRGDFDASAQSNITGNGVTIILTSSTGSGYGTVTMNGGLTANMSAPTTGSTAGILFYGDRASSGLNQKLTGGSSQVLSGVAYFPTGDVTYHGQTGTTGNPCFQIVASTITLTGGGNFGNNCTPENGPLLLFE